MYETFYGLSSKPFQLNPDPSFYFGSKQHRRASAYLEYGLHQSEGFIVITGDVGAGKTTIVRALLESLDPSKIVAAHLVSTQLDADDTLRQVGSAFGIRTKDVTKSDILVSLEAFLISITGMGKRCLLVVDEAQNLTPRAVEELRMLSNFQFGNHALLQSFLVGQPEFRQILLRPQMLQLRQRVIASCHIGPMDAQETEGYIRHRLRCAGSTGNPKFQPNAYVAIFKASGGIPRRINSICDRLLLLGFLAGKTVFSQSEVEEVTSGIHEEALMPIENSASGLAGIDKVSEHGTSRETAQLIAQLSADKLADRFLRVERSLLKLQQINSSCLALLRRLLAAGQEKQAEKDIGSL